MFGYIMIHEPELRMREISLYRSYYCGLCEDLLAGYGRTGQLTLNYDTAFLGFLLTCLYEPSDERRTETVCLTHPFKKHPMRRNLYTKYAADLTILLARHAGADDWKDEHRPKGLLTGAALSGAFSKASKALPEKSEQIALHLGRLHALERSAKKKGPMPSPDEAAACFGDMMAELFAFQKDAWESPLRAMGFYLGKYIYLLDAYEDLEKDRKTGSFNPLLPVEARMKQDGTGAALDFESFVRSLLTMQMASCCRAFEALPIVENIDILRNILYAGIWIKYEQIRAKRNPPEPVTEDITQPDPEDPAQTGPEDLPQPGPEDPSQPGPEDPTQPDPA